MKPYQKVLALCLLMLGLIVPASGYAHEEDQAVVIHMFDDRYEPASIEMEVGEKIIFENLGENSHWPASDIHPTHQIYSDFDPLAGVAPGESWEFIFEKPGIWRWHDHLYPELTGKITVTGESIASEPTGDPWYYRAWSFVGDSWRKWHLDDDSRYILENDTELRLYVEKFGIEATAKHLTATEEVSGDCHDVAHDAGRFAYGEIGNDIFSKHLPHCHSGIIHGGTEAFFAINGTDNLDEDLNVICSDLSVNQFFTHQCMHGIGHGLTAWTSYDVPESLELCELVDEPWMQNSCFSGVFMENIVGGLNDDSDDAAHYTKYLDDTDPHMPCNILAERYVDSCYGYQSAQILRVTQGDPQATLDVCAEAPGINAKEICFDSAGRDFSAIARGNHEMANAMCTGNNHPGELKQKCLLGAVQNLFWVPEAGGDALDFCGIIANEHRYSCYTYMITRAFQLFTETEQATNFCNRIKVEGSPDLYELCTDRTGI